MPEDWLDQIEVGTVLEDSNGFRIKVTGVDRVFWSFRTVDLKVEAPCISVERTWALDGPIQELFEVIQPPAEPVEEVVENADLGATPRFERDVLDDDSACGK